MPHPHNHVSVTSFLYHLISKSVFRAADFQEIFPLTFCLYLLHTNSELHVHPVAKSLTGIKLDVGVVLLR